MQNEFDGSSYLFDLFQEWLGLQDAIWDKGLCDSVVVRPFFQVVICQLYFKYKCAVAKAL